MQNSSSFYAPDSQLPLITALVLGPKAENVNVLSEVLEKLVLLQKKARQEYHKEDPGDFITPNTKKAPIFKATQDIVKGNINFLLELLQDELIPLFSPRYGAHMSTDQSLPAILAYLSTMFYDLNNSAFEASTLMSVIEAKCGLQLCAMVGYNVTTDSAGSLPAWGHLTSGATAANFESMWAARNLKFYPFALREAMKSDLNSIRDKLKVKLCTGKEKLFDTCDTWELLNLDAATILDLPLRIADILPHGISTDHVKQYIMKYEIQTIGKDTLKTKSGIGLEPIVLAARNKLHSWSKSAAVLGIGSENLRSINVDAEARMSIKYLEEELQGCLQKKIPIYQVVTVVGSSDVGSIDRLKDVLDLREKFKKLGLTFVIHADAAWGGYFSAMLNFGSEVTTVKTNGTLNPQSVSATHVGLRKDTAEQLGYLRFSDSITIDPHNAGYVPHPVGSLCFRDGRMKQFVTYTGSKLDHGSLNDMNMGIYGIEGSRPGAAALTAFVAHATIGLTAYGHGAFLSEAMYACRRISAHWSAISTDNTSFTITTLSRLPSEKDSTSEKADIEKQKKFIRDNILFNSSDKIFSDKDSMNLLNELGPDLNINVFACNFRHRDGTVNTSIKAANELNRAVVTRLSATMPKDGPRTIPFYLTSTIFKQDEYGDCVTKLKERMGLDSGPEDLLVLRNVVMSPFTTTNNFVDTLIEAFQEVLEEEVENARNRVGIYRQQYIHRFILHRDRGDDVQNGYLVYIPTSASFHQIIISVKFPKFKLEEKELEKNLPLIIESTRPRHLHDILVGPTIIGKLQYGESPTNFPVRITISKVLIDQPSPVARLSMPHSRQISFYIYGTKQAIFLTNVNTSLQTSLLCAEAVYNKRECDLSPKELETGKLFVSVYNISEAEMLLLQDTSTSHFFERGKVLQVNVYKTQSNGQPLVSENDKVTAGTITLTGRVYVGKLSLNLKSPMIAAESTTLTPMGQLARSEEYVAKFLTKLQTVDIRKY